MAARSRSMSLARRVSIAPTTACSMPTNISSKKLSRQRSLGSAQISVTEDYHLSRSAKVVRTAVVMAAYLGVDLCSSLVGPALLDLRLLTHTTTSEISLIFLVGGILALVSCVVVGPILDKINHYLVVGIAMVGLALLVAAAPFSNNLGTILLTLGPPEFCGCAVAMGAQLIGLELWHDESGPVLQALNFVAIAGSIVAPLLVQPFVMVEEAGDSSVNDTGAENTGGRQVPLPSFTSEDESRTIGVFFEDVTTGRYASENFTTAAVNTTLGFMDDLTSFVTDTRKDGDETDVKYAFWIAGGYSFVVGLFSVGIFFVSRSSLKRDVSNDEDSDDRDHSKGFVVALAVLVFFFNVFYAGIEVGYAGLLVTFVVEHLNWTKKTGTWLLILLEVSNCIVTAICIPVSKFVKPNILMAIDLVILNAALIVQALFVEYHDAVMWVCTAGVGIGYSILMPCTLTWLDSVIEVNGKFSSAYWAGYFAGFMTLPVLSGFLFTEVDQLCFIYFNLGCSVAATIFFVLLKRRADSHVRDSSIRRQASLI